MMFSVDLEKQQDCNGLRGDFLIKKLKTSLKQDYKIIPFRIWLVMYVF